MSNQLYYETTEYELVINNGGRLVFPMHDTHIKIYKGTDNAVDFMVYDDSRRKYNVSGMELVFTLFNTRTKQIALQRPAELVEASKGHVRIRITHDDVSNLNAGYYSFSVKTVDDSGFSKVLHTDLSHKAMGVIKLVDGVVPGPTDTHVADTFTFDGIIHTSAAFKADSDRNYTIGLHTIATYVTGFTGKLYIQFSLDEFVPTQDEDWTNVQVNQMNDYLNYENASGIDPFNFTLVCRWIRFRWEGTAGTVDKILLRN